MAKKNRAPRPTIDDLYLAKGEIVPGVMVVDPVTKYVVQMVADHDGWYTPELLEGFDRKRYREWKREMIKKWRANEPIVASGP
jgi:hypothetical protein